MIVPEIQDESGPERDPNQERMARAYVELHHRREASRLLFFKRGRLSFESPRKNSKDIESREGAASAVVQHVSSRLCLTRICRIGERTICF